MEKITVNGFEIGGNQTYIVADIGSNHKQDLTLAKESIEAAAEAGANAIKFQSIQLDELYLRPDAKTTTFIRKLEFPEEWHYLLKEYCDNRGIVFFSSPTYLKAVDILEEVNVPLYKLASAQVGTFPGLVKKVAALGKPVILSTGLVSYSELENVVRLFYQANNPRFIILHCNSIYPTPYEKVNLGLMDTYQKMFRCMVGFSDHTEGIYVPIAAVARGAKVIEKHFTLDRKMDSPDAALAVDPPTFKDMVAGIRAVEKAVHQNVRLEIFDEELGFKKSIATRLVLAKDKKKGEIFTANDFTFLRYNEGVDCKDLEKVVGRKSAHPLVKGDVLGHHDFI